MLVESKLDLFDIFRLETVFLLEVDFFCVGRVLSVVSVSNIRANL